MLLSRRHFVIGSTVLPAAAQAATGLDASTFGVRANADGDQTAVLQKAIDQAATSRQPLFLAPGVYRTGPLNLAAGAQVTGVRGATRLTLARPGALFTGRGANHVTLSGLVLDGGGAFDAGSRGLIQVTAASSLRINDCEIVRASKAGIALEQCDGEIARNKIENTDTAIFCNDARGMLITGNTIHRSGNNGICVWQSEKRDDGTQVVDNRIEDIAARAGGSGQNGNAINVYRAANVSVRGNRIRNAAFSAIRGNAASNIQMLGNACTGLGEVALYAEFDFEGAIIADNTVDGAALGVAVTNFNKGGRLAVVRGNLIRNLVPKRPAGTDPNDGAGIGIGIEADTNVTGNVIENAPFAGVTIGFMQYLRDASVTANIIRNAGIGIAVSVSRGAGTALISNNLIAESRRGSILGMDGNNAVTGDLMQESAASRFPHLTLAGNRAR